MPDAQPESGQTNYRAEIYDYFKGAGGPLDCRRFLR